MSDRIIPILTPSEGLRANDSYLPFIGIDLRVKQLGLGYIKRESGDMTFTCNNHGFNGKSPRIIQTWRGMKLLEGLPHESIFQKSAYNVVSRDMPRSPEVFSSAYPGGNAGVRVQRNVLQRMLPPPEEMAYITQFLLQHKIPYSAEELAVEHRELKREIMHPSIRIAMRNLRHYEMQAEGALRNSKERQ